MKKFSYRGKNLEGKTFSGVVEARNEKQAAILLHERGLTVISLKPYRERSGLSASLWLFKKVSFGELVAFTRQLSTTIIAGLSLTEALSLLEVQLSPAMSKVISGILRRIEGGESLADALAKYPKVFSPVFIALIRAGESAGVLEKVLLRLADNLEKQRDFKQKVQGAMVYPVIIIVGMVAVGFIMITFVLPRMMILYQEFGTELPLATKFLIKVSELTSAFWWLGLAMIIILFYGFSLSRKTAAGRRYYAQLFFRLPIFGALTKKMILTEFTRTLGLLVGTGVPIIEALNIVAETTGNEIYRSDINEAAKKVEKGFPLAVALTESENFPPIVSQMIGVGEETGKIDEVLEKVSIYFETESEQAIKALTTAIEPLIMVLLGIGVGFMVIAVIMPIYNLTSQF